MIITYFITLCAICLTLCVSSFRNYREEKYRFQLINTFTRLKYLLNEDIFTDVDTMEISELERAIETALDNLIYFDKIKKSNTPPLFQKNNNY